MLHCRPYEFCRDSNQNNNHPAARRDFLWRGVEMQMQMQNEKCKSLKLGDAF